jgi:23S rRNA pseudouridine2457 synthase
VDGAVSDESLDAIRKGGIVVKGSRSKSSGKAKVYTTQPAEASIMAGPPPLLWDRVPPIRYRESIPTTWLNITLREGKNRQVRRMTASIGHPTLRLIRHDINGVGVGNLKPGEWRVVPEGLFGC